MSTPRREASARRAAMKSDGVVVAAGHYHFFEGCAATEHVRCLDAASGRDVPAGEVEGGKGRSRSANISPNNVIFDTSQPDRSRVAMFCA